MILVLGTLKIKLSSGPIQAQECLHINRKFFHQYGINYLKFLICVPEVSAAHVINLIVV